MEKQQQRSFRRFTSDVRSLAELVEEHRLRPLQEIAHELRGRVQTFIVPELSMAVRADFIDIRDELSILLQIVELVGNRDMMIFELERLRASVERLGALVDKVSRTLDEERRPAARIDQEAADWPRCSVALKRVTQRIRASPMSFAQGGELLDRLFSVKPLRHERAASLRKLRRTDLSHRMKLAAWRHDGPPQPYPSLDYWRAILWTLKLPLTMTRDEAQAALIVAWLAYDDQASTFRPLLCSLQKESWNSRSCSVEAYSVKDSNGDIGRVQPAFDWSEFVEQVELAFSKFDAVSSTEARSPEAERRTKDGLSAEDRAAAIVLKEPDISDAALAERVGRHRSRVGRWPAVKRAREAVARLRHRGWRRGGDLEAEATAEE